MSDNQEILPILDPIAFAVALVLAPLLVAVFSFWILLIPVVAVLFGGVPYLVFGTPVFLWMVTRYPVTLANLALGGILAHALFVLCLAAWSAAQPYPDPGTVWFFAAFGLPHAAAWGASFASLYRTFYRSLPLPQGPMGR